MSQLLNTNDRKLLIKVAKFAYFGMKEYTSLPNVVSEEIDNILVRKGPFLRPLTR